MSTTTTTTTWIKYLCSVNRSFRVCSRQEMLYMMVPIWHYDLTILMVIAKIIPFFFRVYCYIYYCCIVYPNSFCQPHNIPTKPQTIDRVYAVQWRAILIKSVWAFSFRDLVTIFWARFGFDFFSLFHLIYYLNILTEITLFTSMRLINYVWIWV